MTEEQLLEFEEYALNIKHNRDYFSRAKIIELLVEKVKQLNDPNYVTVKCEHKYTRYYSETGEIRCIDCPEVLNKKSIK